MRFFGYPYNDLVICKDNADYLTNYYSNSKYHIDKAHMQKWKHK